jgi:hypothetical protein
MLKFACNHYVMGGVLAQVAVTAHFVPACSIVKVVEPQETGCLIEQFLNLRIRLQELLYSIKLSL